MMRIVDLKAIVNSSHKLLEGLRKHLPNPTYSPKCIAHRSNSCHAYLGIMRDSKEGMAKNGSWSTSKIHQYLIAKC